LRRAYLWRETEPLAQIDAEDGTERLSYLHTDRLATPRLATDGAGTPVWRRDGEAFGSAPATPDQDGDGRVTEVPLRYPGQYFDAQTGLHYDVFRDYDPGTDRYLESDRAGWEHPFRSPL
jgi:RHS repeat-associated protein